MLVRVQGTRPENIQFLVHEVFESLIAESFHGVTYDFLLPCNDCLKVVSCTIFNLLYFSSFLLKLRVPKKSIVGFVGYNGPVYVCCVEDSKSDGVESAFPTV